MKIKEIPISFYYSEKLKRLPIEKLAEASGNEIPVVVSLTTIPSRLSKVHITIRSILKQSPKPKKILLWINESHQHLIPQSLKKLESKLFEIHLTHLHCSHKKLIHSIKLFPNDTIVTSDDDCLYREGWLKSLYQTHTKNPKKIIAHRIRCIKKDQDGNYLPYKKWVCSGNENPKALMAIGAEGVLYPPKIFDETVFNEKLFLQLAPKADDLWFKAMALKQGVLYMKANNSPKDSIPLMGTQKISLKKENIDQDKNRSQWQALENHFNLQID